MQNSPLVTIAIPTYNRALFLKKLLECITSQIGEVFDQVQICVSNNASTDNTKAIATNFQAQYPGLIKYGENKENLGFAINLVKVMQMAGGQFVWLLGDDDLVAQGGVQKVVNFIKEKCDNNTGLIALGNKSYFLDDNGNEVVYFRNTEKEKPNWYEIKSEEVICQSFPNNTFISVLIYNNVFLKKILAEEEPAIKKALLARDYIHNFLYQLMFLKYRQLGAVRLNEEIIIEELHYYKFYVEDRFGLHYAAKKKLNDLLMSLNYMDDYYKNMLLKGGRGSVKNMIIEMVIMKAFKTFNYVSFLGCVKMFFRECSFKNALTFSLAFTALVITPGFILKILYKQFLKIRLKEKWQEVWFSLVVSYSKMTQGSRRQMS